MTRQIIHLAHFAMALLVFVFGIYHFAHAIETGAPIALIAWCGLFAIAGAIASIGLVINMPNGRA